MRIKSLRMTMVGAAVLLMGLLSGCAINYTYNNSDQYMAGDRVVREQIDSIDINYLSGNVVFSADATNEISIKETSNKELDDDRKVHTWVDGGTLYVKYCASGSNLDFTHVEKELEITVPKELKLSLLRSGMSSGGIKASDVKADDVDISASSGSIDLNCEARNIELSVSSGDVHLKQNGSSDSITLDASSGRIMADIEKSASLGVSVSSGSSIINAIAIDDVRYDASSGDMSLSMAEAPKNSSFEASSGKMGIVLPEDADLSVDVNTSSGDFDYELPFEKTGESYKCGTGVNKMKISTSSGDVSIKKK